MASSIGHGLVGWAFGVAADPNRASRRFSVACAAAGVAPDLDVLLHFLPGSTYAALGGHRGITHSLFFAAVVGAAISLIAFRRSELSRVRVWMGLAGALASHDVLDMLTSYGGGVTLFAPFSWEVVTFSWHPLDPDAAARAASTAWGQLGLAVGNEVLWVWLPALAVVAVVSLRRLRGHRARLVLEQGGSETPHGGA